MLLLIMNEWVIKCDLPLENSHYQEVAISVRKHIDALVQDCSNSSALAMELLQSCTKPSTYSWWESWWRHQMETFSALLALCVGNSPVTGEFPAQRRLNKRSSKQSWGWWFETPSCSLWRHCNDWHKLFSGIPNLYYCNDFERSIGFQLTHGWPYI